MAMAITATPTTSPTTTERANNMRLPRTIRLGRGAYTLAELLIVMTIMLMLIVITLPAIKNVMQDGNVREASRQLNAYFAMAKARAVHTGRPCGVMMICDLQLGLQEPASAMPNISLCD